ncbi:cytochrome P450 [Streptomyces solisilvae]|uniref:cytochrome P450 n=1 Tax=Streptomyces malaysiensis TaxID=92644 RepID=UPI0036B2B7EB
MTSPTRDSASTPGTAADSTPPPGCPAHTGHSGHPGHSGHSGETPAGERLESLHCPEFAADPAATYARLRTHGHIAPAELSPGVPVSLVTSYQTALDILRSPETFSKDARHWQALADGTVPMDNPVVPMMMYRPNALCSDGEEHFRLRSAISDTLDRLDIHALRRYVERSADFLIDLFGPRGEADLLKEYSARLPLLVFNQLFGCPPELSDKLVRSLSALFDIAEDSEQANVLLAETLFELVALKRAEPGPDMTSWLIAHPAELTDEEMVHQIVVLVGAGTQPLQNLICNGLLLLLSDERFAGDLAGGTMLIGDALNEVLWKDPPLANFCIHYPRHDTTVDGHRLPKGEPVVISLAAANNDPYLLANRRGNRAHLAWSAGPHTCPGKDPAQVIASVAVEKLLDRLPDVELAVPAERLEWRPGPFHRALAALPVRFPRTAAKSDEALAEMAAAASATIAGAVGTAPKAAGEDDAAHDAPHKGRADAAPSPEPSPEPPLEPSPEPSSERSPGAELAVVEPEPGPEHEARRRWWKSLAQWWRRG